MKREYCFSVSKSFTPHFNHTVGKFVRNRREFTDALKEGSDKASEESGTEHRFVPVDMGDRPNVTDENAKELEEANRKRGWSEPTKRIFT